MPFAHLDVVVQEASRLAHRFREAGHRVFLVGGIVRDLWLDRPIAEHLDLDLTTDASPAQTRDIVAPVAEALWLQGERFGTIGAQLEGRAFEITTHRSEVYLEHSRKPHVAFSRAIDEDLSRRDFTANAMALELPDAELIDPFGGADDLAASVLRTPLDPEVSFTDDPLRMLRAARFTAGYGLEPVAELVEAMRLLAPRLDIVSAERVRDELDKLLAVPDPTSGLALLTATGLAVRFLPDGDLDPVRLAAVASLPPDPVVRLAALVATPGADVAAVLDRLRRFRQPNERVRVTGRLLRGLDQLRSAPPIDPPAYRRWYRSVGEQREDVLALAEALDDGNEELLGQLRRLHRDLGADLADAGPPLDGAAVMALLGMDEGPVVGEALAFLQQVRDDEGPLTAADAEARLRHWWSVRN